MGQLHILDKDLWFPPVEDALEDGLLAVGGNLSTDRLLLAYHNGIFPWYNEDEIPMWWCPDPRFVLFPAALKVSKSMRPLLKKNTFEFRVNTAFDEVINNCAAIERKGMDGTWISAEVAEAYTALHHMGYAHSAEAWHDGTLAGGIYGIRLGNVFFGESMFSKESNASKFAFIKWVQLLQLQGVAIVDCQVYTEHLESLGAGMISRTEFMSLLEQNI